jgi:hypothetical protein
MTYIFKLLFSCFVGRRPQRRSCPYDQLDSDLLQRLAKKSKKKIGIIHKQLFYSMLACSKNLQKSVTARFIAPAERIKSTGSPPLSSNPLTFSSLKPSP